MDTSLRKTFETGIAEPSSRNRMNDFLKKARQILSVSDCDGFDREEVQILLMLGTAALLQTTDPKLLSVRTGLSESFVKRIWTRLESELLLEIDPDVWIEGRGMPSLDFILVGSVLAGHSELGVGMDGDVRAIGILGDD